MCDETIKCEVEQIKAKHAKTQAQLLKPTLTVVEEEIVGKILATVLKPFQKMRNNVQRMYPKQSVAPIAVADTSTRCQGLNWTSPNC